MWMRSLYTLSLCHITIHRQNGAIDKLIQREFTEDLRVFSHIPILHSITTQHLLGYRVRINNVLFGCIYYVIYVLTGVWGKLRMISTKCGGWCEVSVTVKYTHAEATHSRVNTTAQCLLPFMFYIFHINLLPRGHSEKWFYIHSVCVQSTHKNNVWSISITCIFISAVKLFSLEIAMDAFRSLHSELERKVTMCACSLRVNWYWKKRK